MADQEINFRLNTEADTTGAEETQSALKKVGEAATETATKSSESQSTMDQTQERLDQLSTRAEKLKTETKEFGQEQEKTTKALNLGNAAMTGVAAGGAVVAKIFGQIGEAIRSIDVDQLRQVNAEMAAEVVQLQATAELLTDPINAIQRLISGETVGEGFAKLNESIARVANYDEDLRKEKVAAVIRAIAAVQAEEDKETAALVKKRQELERILELRGKLAGLRNEGLEQEVQSAELRGGDVGLAKSNALAGKLQQGLEELGGQLQQAEAGRQEVQKEYDTAVAKYNKVVSDGLDKLDPEALPKLGLEIDAAREKLQAADQALADQKEVFKEQKLNLLRGVENELATLESDGTKAVSDAAQKVRDNVYGTLKDEVANIGKETSQTITTSFSKLRESHQKTNQAIVQNVDDLIGVIRELNATVTSQGRAINDLQIQMRASNGAGY